MVSQLSSSALLGLRQLHFVSVLQIDRSIRLRPQLVSNAILHTRTHVRPYLSRLLVAMRVLIGQYVSGRGLLDRCIGGSFFEKKRGLMGSSKVIL